MMKSGQGDEKEMLWRLYLLGQFEERRRRGDGGEGAYSMRWIRDSRA